MQVPKQQREVRQIETVETYNLYRSIDRLRDCTYPGNHDRWRRALYHALAMQGIDDDTLTRIREALRLP